ncbi:IS256 family transposase [uncultured Methanospirillum sp.]|uniref:IS256 family transposase n=1 Tax=uncultured Methanospirillum sp. TaxID=262503 RepID=UPI0029C96475|nr:IS256 family transposase [uncultured Methanospirillum sp.]
MDLLDFIEEYLADQDEAMKKLITFFLNLVMEFELEQQTGTSRYERSENRTAHRNGKRSRTLKTRHGDIILDKPDLREKPFQTVVFDRYSRVERALENTIVESYIQGVSTRKVKTIIETLGIEGISADTISRMAQELDQAVKEFLERPIEMPIIYLNVDAVYLKVRSHGRFVSKAVLLIAGVREDGYRELIGLKVADREDEAFWRSLFDELKERGLRGVQMVTSDGHKGIQAAVLESFPGTCWQMCLVHFLRAIMRNIPVRSQDIFRPFLKAALFENNGDLNEISEDLHYHGYNKAVRTIERFYPDINNYQAFPKEHWKKIRTTNLMERVNKEIKRRARVVGAFPSEDSLIRLIGSILMDMNEEWITGKRYLSIDPYVVESVQVEKTNVSLQPA